MIPVARSEFLRRVERHLAALDRSGAPGAAVGVVLDGETALRTGFGCASVEHDVKITPQTVFTIASVTKQFTCLSALMLVGEWRCDLEADLRHMLADFPDYGAVVTAQHLMRNVSGVRDSLELVRLGGADLTYPLRRAAFHDVIARQRTLNFAPGSRFLYSNANFVLLQQLIEQVSGKPLKQFMAERIFAPAGMERAQLLDSEDAVVPGMAGGYHTRGDGFVRALDLKQGGGEGGVRASLDDLLAWDRNWRSARVGGADLLRALATPRTFNNGRPNHYACGIMTKPWRGHATIGHGGLLPGFLTEFLRLPSLGLTVIVMANSDRFAPYALAREIVDLALDIAPSTGRPDPARYAQHAGIWFAEDGPASFAFSADDQGVRTATNGPAFPFLQAEDGALEAHRGAYEFTLRFAADGAATVEDGAGYTATYRRIERGALPAGLDGVYESAELDATWTIAGEQVRVRGPVASGTNWQLLPLVGDCAQIDMQRSWLPAMADLRAERDAAGRVMALLVQAGRVRHLRLACVAEPR
jgi:CubicO group peptidase (beta-lactamase class C family)